VLGDEWKRARAEEVVQYLYDSAPPLDERPPYDQINFLNGILDLADMSLGDHTPEFRTPIQLPVQYDPDAECTLTLKFLGEVLEPDAIECWLEMVGYMMVPYNGLQHAFLARGGGANGKSTAIAQIEALLGKGNVSNVPLQRLEEDRFAVVQLGGKLLNTFADLDHRALKTSSAFKSITGGDALLAERKYGDGFSMTPYARLLFSANEPLATSDSSDAYFRRWIIFEFNQRFDAQKADRRLIERLTTRREMSGLANEGLRRLPALLKRGHFTTGESSRAAVERFRVDTDTIAGFISEACRLGPEEQTTKASLFPAYRNWCIESNRRPLGKQNFNRRLREIRPELSLGPVGGRQIWKGIAVDLEADQ
jgi:putative DNA primase/helicase